MSLPIDIPSRCGLRYQKPAKVIKDAVAERIEQLFLTNAKLINNTYKHKPTIIVKVNKNR